MKLLTNPIFLKMVLLLFASGFAIVMAGFMMRRVRKSLSDSAVEPSAAGNASQLPLDTYHAVIQELKQQKHELSTMRDAESRRARSSENISAAVSVESIERRDFLRAEWPDSSGQSGRQEHSRNGVADRHERGRTLSPYRDRRRFGGDDTS